MSRNISGYSRSSIIIHWFTAILVIALFLTHEDDFGSALITFHVGAGAIFGVFLIWRVIRRIMRGMTSKPEQAAIYNLASQVVIWGFLISILLVTLSGYILPWSEGKAIDIFGLLQIPSPIAGSHDFSEIIEEVHEISGQLILPLFVLHVLGALKHRFVDKDDVMQRMMKAVTNGR